MPTAWKYYNILDMTYKFIALDIDGTLANSEKKISDRNKATLAKAAAQGAHIALVSGRPTPGILPTAKAIDMDQIGGFILSFNGAKIINYTTGEVLYQNVLSAADVAAICAEAAALGVATITYSDEALYSTSAQNQYVQKEAFINQMPVVEVPDLAAATTFETPKCLLVDHPEKLVQVEKHMKEKFPNLSIYRSEPYFLEIVPLGVDKAFSLGLLLEKYGCTAQNLMACGDGFNDLSMVRYAGMGVAMQNAQQVVKEVANYVSPYTNDEDAVALAIEKFVL
jgi:Cof subfamily protein (haloacid dehalogenase superfamily)